MPCGWRGILRDVPRRRRAEALRREKMAAGRSKSEFLARRLYLPFPHQPCKMFEAAVIGAFGIVGEDAGR